MNVGSGKLLLALTSTVNLGVRFRHFILSKILCVLKWGSFFDDRRGLTTTGHSPSNGDDSSGHSLTCDECRVRNSLLSAVPALTAKGTVRSYGLRQRFKSYKNIKRIRKK
jgi:hypothetical protein